MRGEWCGIGGPFRAVVVGARGGVGQAFVQSLARSEAVAEVVALGRDANWCESSPEGKVRRLRCDITCEQSLAAVGAALSGGPPLRFIINCSGLLHTESLRPERTWRHLDLDVMRQVFEVNTFGVALLIKHLLPAMSREGRSVFATLSARVGSIEDNRIGGWYSYRASKAAQNMVVKTASIEASRRWPQLALLALHPGTVETALSEPFTARLPESHDLFSSAESCRKLMDVIAQRGPADSGGFFAWDGQRIPW